MNGPSRRQAAMRASLVAILLGAAVAGSVTVAGRLAARTNHVSDIADYHPPAPLLTPNPMADTPTSTTSGSASPSTSSTSATPSSTPTTASSRQSSAPAASTGQAPVTTSVTATVPQVSPTTQVIELVNQVRAQAGCQALREDSRLDQAAQAHSADMSRRNYFSHDTPEGISFDMREMQAGYPDPGGENIAMGQTSAQQVMRDWLNSSGHRRNILNCGFVAIGVGLDTNGWYWTQDFGR